MSRDEFDPCTPEFHLTDAELVSVRARMLQHAGQLERGAASALEALASKVRDGAITAGEDQDDPLKEALDPIQRQWRAAQDVKAAVAALTLDET